MKNLLHKAMKFTGLFLIMIFVATSVLSVTQTTASAKTTVKKSAKVTYTNVTYSDVNGTKTNYTSLTDLKSHVKINALSNAKGKSIALANKKTYAATATDLVNQINAYRQSLGLNTLKVNATLSTAAMHRAAESAYSNWNVTAYENGTTKRHIRPNLQKASTIASYYKITGNYGENYARFFSTTESVLSAWEGSGTHNALLTNSKYTKIGIGIAQASNGDYYWIALFN